MLHSTLSRRDRVLLAVSIACVLLMVLLLALVSPSANEDDPLPSSYGTGRHGARAAYLLLQQSGYHVERWSRPLNELPQYVDAHTTVLFAEPFYGAIDDAREPVRALLRRGARVLVTGYTGGLLVPENQVKLNPLPFGAACTGEADGFSALAASGPVRMEAGALWKQADPRQQAAYLCFGQPIVVQYPYAKGQVVWWAASTPLENASLGRDGDLALLFNSIGDPGSTRVLWDESLHGDQPSLWSYASGTPTPFLWAQLALVGTLLVFSFSRRSGPLRPDPVISRADPLEFMRSLGALYRKAGAAQLAVSVAYAGLRLQMEREAGVPLEADAEHAASLAAQRLPVDPVQLGATLQAAAAAGGAPKPMPEKRALALVQALRRYEELLPLQIHTHP